LNVYPPHSLRAITATLLLDIGADIRKVQISSATATSQQRRSMTNDRRSLAENASHDIPIKID